MQDGVPAYFASRTLTPAEKNYQILEHETLATIWGMECLSHFLFGDEFTLETDQEPMVRFYKKMDDISPRITMLIYCSFKFRSFKVVYLKGKRSCYAEGLSNMSPMLPRWGEED